MTKETVIYYHFNKLNCWLVLNIFLLAGIFYAFCRESFTFALPQMQILTILFIASSSAWCWKHLFKRPVAILTDKHIKIDFCEPLAWKDIKYAQERVVKCGFSDYRILILVPKAHIHYTYNFLQKHNACFTAFSVPLDTNITPLEAKKMTDFIAKKVTIKTL